SVMGFDISIPPEGIRGVADGGERFLGIFANLAIAPPMPLTRPAETTLEVSDLVLDPESMELEHWNQGAGNTVWLHFGGGGTPGTDYEYSYRIDEMGWSSWTRDPRLQIGDDILQLQARHVVEARARVAGDPATVDPTPARAELLIDILPPVVQLSREEGT